MNFFQILVAASPGPHARTFEFLKKQLGEYFSFSLNMGSHGGENFKRLLLLQIAAEPFQTFPEFSSQWSSQNYVWDFPIFKDFVFENFEFTIVACAEIKKSIIRKTSDGRAKRSEI